MSRLSRLFWCLALAHAAIWSIVPLFIRHSISSDLLEASIWGHQFQWGYDKNPWLPALMAKLVGYLGTSGIGFYLTQQLFVLLALWSTWKLASLISNKKYALIASLMYLACVHYSLEIVSFNDNYLVLGLWSFAILLFYQIVTLGYWRYWLSCGVVLALATMAKYNCAILVPTFGIYLLVFQPKIFKSLKPYVALFVFALIIAPNLFWLFGHSFIAIKYIFNESSAGGGYLIILRNILIDFLPALILLFFGISWSRNEQLKIARSDFLFICFCGIAPLIITIIAAYSTALSLTNHEWDWPFFGLWGLIILCLFRFEVSEKSLKRFVFAVIFVLIVFPAAAIYLINFDENLIHKIGNHRNINNNFPAPEVGNLATQIWHEHYSKPLKYVAGNRHLAGMIGFYSEDKPSVFIDWNPALAPWIDVAAMKKYGAIFVTDSYYNSDLHFPKNILDLYPNLIILKPIKVSYHHYPDKTVDVVFGILPPQQ